jgi:hypothetical protein
MRFSRGEDKPGTADRRARASVAFGIGSLVFMALYFVIDLGIFGASGSSFAAAFTSIILLGVVGLGWMLSALVSLLLAWSATRNSGVTLDSQRTRRFAIIGAILSVVPLATWLLWFSF